MKDKADILLQIEELTSVKDELSSEVSSEHVPKLFQSIFTYVLVISQSITELPHIWKIPDLF